MSRCNWVTLIIWLANQSGTHRVCLDVTFGWCAEWVLDRKRARHTVLVERAIAMTTVQQKVQSVLWLAECKSVITIQRTFQRIYGGDWIDVAQDWVQWPVPTWHPRLFFMGIRKKIVYSEPIRDLQHLRHRITDAVATISPEMIKRCSAKIDYRLDVCKATNRVHIEIL